MANFPEIDTSAVPPGEPPMLPSVRRDWLVFGLSAGCLILAGISICLAIATWRRYTPKVITKTKEVEVVVEKEVPVEVIKEVHRAAYKEGDIPALRGFVFRPIGINEDQLRGCFGATGKFNALAFQERGDVWTDEDEEIILKIHRNSVGGIGGVQLNIEVASWQDARIEGTRDNNRILRFVVALEQLVKVVDPKVSPFLPTWVAGSVLQPNVTAYSDLLGTRVSVMNAVHNKNAGMIITLGVGVDPDYGSE